MKVKKATTFDEQIEILKSRGMIIPDIERAKLVLSTVNYYRFTAYLLQFKVDEEKYVDGIIFDDIYKIYLFDKELRILLLDIIGSIEIAFRTYIAYTLATNHGSLGYLESKNFINKDYHNNFLLKLEGEKEKNSSKLFIKHHNIKYDGRLPIWVAVEIIPFGSLSKLYSNMLPCDKTYIKNNLCKVNVNFVDTWLQSITHLRNLCAHYGRVYNTRLPIIKIMKKYKGYNVDVECVFSYLLAIKSLIVNIDVWEKFYFDLKVLMEKYKDIIDLNLIGFPENWKEILEE